MALVAGNLGGGMVQTFAHPYGGQVVETIGAAPVVVSIQEVLWQVQVNIPTEMVKNVPESPVQNVQQLVEIPQVGLVAVVPVAVPPPPAANCKSQGDFVSLVNEHIAQPATHLVSDTKLFPSYLDIQALPKEEETAPKIRRAVSCPARTSNVFAANFPCLCDNWSMPASGRTVCKFGSRGLCHDDIGFCFVRIPECRRCHSDRCAALYRCFQDGMYRRTTKQKFNRQARRKRRQLAITSASQESAETDVQLATKVSTANTKA
jgi:hypothetical protein